MRNSKTITQAIKPTTIARGQWSHWFPASDFWRVLVLAIVTVVSVVVARSFVQLDIVNAARPTTALMCMIIIVPPKLRQHILLAATLMMGSPIMATLVWQLIKLL